MLWNSNHFILNSSDEPKSNQPVQMVQYSGTSSSPPTTTLKSLHDPYDDNLSLGSQRSVSNKTFVTSVIIKIILLAQLAAFFAKAHRRSTHRTCDRNRPHTRERLARAPAPWFTSNATFDKRSNREFFIVKSRAIIEREWNLKHIWWY